MVCDGLLEPVLSFGEARGLQAVAHSKLLDGGGEIVADSLLGEVTLGHDGV